MALNVKVRSDNPAPLPVTMIDALSRVVPSRIVASPEPLTRIPRNIKVPLW